LEHPLSKEPTIDEAIKISEIFGIPMHPSYTPYWNSITPAQLILFLEYLQTGEFQEDKIILPFKDEQADAKRALELAGIQHQLFNNEYVIIERKPQEA